jgi:hypothetical protein
LEVNSESEQVIGHNSFRSEGKETMSGDNTTLPECRQAETALKCFMSQTSNQITYDHGFAVSYTTLEYDATRDING